MNAHNEIGVSIVKMFDDVIIPKYELPGSAGCDVRAYLPDTGKIVIHPNETILIPTGLKFAVPWKYEMQIRPRSGLSLKTKLRIANGPGTLDFSYTGELKIIVDNISVTESLTINHQDRIAQLIFAPVVQAKFIIVGSLEATERGEGGFGSTGVK